MLDVNIYDVIPRERILDSEGGFRKKILDVIEKSRKQSKLPLFVTDSSVLLKEGSGNKLDEDIILALNGGEDYELLFTSPPSLAEKIFRLSSLFDIPVSCIGNTTSKQKELKIYNHENKQIEIPVKGYDHFK